MLTKVARVVSDPVEFKILQLAKVHELPPVAEINAEIYMLKVIKPLFEFC